MERFAVIVLDTHIWVRWVDPSANPLSASLVAAIAHAEQLAISAITCWEVAWLVRRGRLDLNLSLADWLEQALDGSGVICLPIDRRIAVRAAALPEHHRDPADRLIIATAMERQAALISLDGAFADYFRVARCVNQRMMQSTKSALRALLPKNAFARGVSVLVGGTAGAQVLTVLAAPLLTRLDSPEDFGLLDMMF